MPFSFTSTGTGTPGPKGDPGQDATLPQNLATTDSPTFDKIYVTHNGDGTNVSVGDDVWIGDVNQSNFMSIQGQQDSSQGGIIFGDALANKIYTSGSGMTLEANNGDMNFWMDGGMYIGASDSSNQIIKRSDLNNIAQTFASASYWSTVDQGPYTASSIQAMTLNNTDWQSDITLESGSHIKVAKSGKYNIAFSAQMYQTQSSGITNIWLAKNGTAMSNTNTKIASTANNPYTVAAWNFFVDASANDYFEIMWSSDSAHTVLEYEAAVGSGATLHPEIPSVIVTINQVG